MRVFIRDLRSVPVLVLIVLALGLAVIGTIAAAPDASGDNPLGMLIYVGPAIPSAAGVLLLSGREDFFGQAFVRMFVLGPVLGVVSAVTVFATTWMPPVARTIREAGASGTHLGLESPHPFVEPLLGGVFSAIAGGLLAIPVLLVVTASRAPRRFARSNMNDLDERTFAQVRRANIALAWVILLAFAIPALLLVEVDGLWIAGVALIPVGLALVWYVITHQRVDRDRRRDAGVSVGLEASPDRD